MTSATYAYAVAGPDDAAVIEGLRGVDGALVQLVGYEALVAVVSPLEPEAALEAVLRARLESLQELEATARSHHRVVEQAAHHAVLLPLRLLTIYQGRERVARVLREGYRTYCEALDHVAGRVELGVKVYLNAGSIPSVDATIDATESATSGRDYLRARRQSRDRRAHSRQRAMLSVDELDRALTRLAVARCEHRTRNQELSRAEGENIFNVAYLVEASRVEAFAQRARLPIASEVRLSVDVTGPWAPYSFTGLGDGAA